MEFIAIATIAFVVSGVIFFFVGQIYRKKIAETKISSAEEEAKKIVEESKKESDRITREAVISAKDEMIKQKGLIEKESKQSKKELSEIENRINKRQEMIDKRANLVEEKEISVLKKKNELLSLEEELKNAKEREIEALSKVSKLSKEDAKNLIMKKLEQDMTKEMAEYIRSKNEEAKFKVAKQSKELLLSTIQRCAADHTSEATVTTVSLPNDDLKGRLIGREGRNIRSIETLTGVDLIIDDTPDMIVLSCFDPIRREVARIAIERLIADGRVHPGKIEEMIEKAKEEVGNTINEEAERALYETGIVNVNSELMQLLGKLRFRTSFGQNVLNHSIEVANLSGIIANELGLNINIAKRAGLLHDIGKAMDHDVEGTHVSLGVELLQKYKEKKEVIWGMEAHHGDCEPKSLEAIIVTIADAISASRPGARRETVGTYIKRLQKLEEICNSYKGVEKSYAIQAGREVRLIVKPQEVNDDKMTILARNVAKQIEKEMTYPGQIKVSVIRENRAEEIAK